MSGGGGDFDYYTDPGASPLLMSDRERSVAILDEREGRARDALSAIRGLLSEADDALDGVESQGGDRLGVALCRMLDDVADKADDMADRMGEHGEEERLEFARACVAEAESNLLLRCEDGDDGEGMWAELEGVGRDFLRPDAPFGGHTLSTSTPSSTSEGLGGPPVGTGTTTTTTTTTTPNNDEAKVGSPLSERDVVLALSSFEGLLRDAASSLRSITPDEAGELAEAALSVARIFLWTASSFVDAVTPQDLALAGTGGERTWASTGGGYDIRPVGDEGHDGVNELGGGEGDSARRRGPTRKRKRVRLLWPPLGPALARWAHRLNDAHLSRVHPVVATLTALALWPAAVAAVLVGGPAVAADHVLQICYDAASPPHDDGGDGEHDDGTGGAGCGILAAAEGGAADLLHVSRLYYLVGRLVLRRTIRVARSEVDRRGGVGRVACDAVGMAVDGVLHPVRTAGMVLDGMMAGWDAAGRVGNFLVEVASASSSPPGGDGGDGGGGFGYGYD